MSSLPDVLSRADLDLTTDPSRPPIVRAPALRSPAALHEWIGGHRDIFHAVIAHYGGLLIRGFPLADPAEVSQVGRLLIGPPMAERETFAPRRELHDGVYSGSAWPSNQAMCMHHELSYAMTFPRLMSFACLGEPDEGGDIPVADSRRVLAALPGELVAEFAELGWMLDRRYGELGVPWTDGLGAAAVPEAEEYCRENLIGFSWTGDGDLRTRQRRPAIIRHPGTGELCWFNQIAFLSRWTLDPAIRDYLSSAYGPDGLPFDTYRGDGAPIGPEAVRTIHEAYESVTIRERWHAGDLLVIDNILMAHGRDPFRGRRETAVMMSAPTRMTECAAERFLAVDMNGTSSGGSAHAGNN
jgi:alpha-ketoglutarate-dependent taurine dioxygenase